MSLAWVQQSKHFVHDVYFIWNAYNSAGQSQSTEISWLNEEEGQPGKVENYMSDKLTQQGELLRCNEKQLSRKEESLGKAWNG